MSLAENIKVLPPGVLDQVSGAKIEARLINFAPIGGDILPGTPDQPIRYSVSRLALSDKDIEARKFLEKQMTCAGMSVTQEAFATIGYYEGTNPKLKPVLIVSHHDSVPNGGMYDGVVGVNAGIEVVDILNRNKIKLPHPIIVISFTEEESSRFNTGLGGSKALTQGLTDAELEQADKDGISQRVALTNLGFDPEQTKYPHPLFSSKNALAAIELHVQQNPSFANDNIELGVIKAIAAPIRYKININNSDSQLSSHEQVDGESNATYLHIDVAGKAGHSGATSMEPGARADALVVQSEILIHLNALQNALKKEKSDTQICIGDLTLNDDASINKIPGSSHLSLRINGTNTDDIKKLTQNIKDFTNRRNQNLHQSSPSNFNEDAITVTEITDSTDTFYDNETFMRCFSTAAYFIKGVQSITTIHRKENNVGTVGTFQFKNGQIKMAVDLRGINKTDRDAAALEIDKIRNILVNSKIVTDGLNISCTKEEIVGGSGDPTIMDSRLVKLAQTVIEENNIGSYTTTFSPAGHDAQNIARADISTVMFFIPSRNNGAAHNPKEYSTPKDLENGAKALLSLVHTLASNPTDEIVT